MKQPEEGQSKREVTWEEIDNCVRKLIVDIPEKATIWGIPTNGTVVVKKILQIRNDVEIYYGDKPEPWMIVVDDIHDSGETALSHQDNGNIVMTLYSRKVEGKNDADFFAEQVDDDDWLVFPWEKE